MSERWKLEMANDEEGRNLKKKARRVRAHTKGAHREETVGK